MKQHKYHELYFVLTVKVFEISSFSSAVVISRCVFLMVFGKKHITVLKTKVSNMKLLSVELACLHNVWVNFPLMFQVPLTAQRHAAALILDARCSH